jgi:amino acid adenylation domain-containing protein
MNLPPEQEAIRAKCFHPSGMFVEFPMEDVEISIPERFEKIVGMHPERLAVKARGCSLTYAALNQAANQIAHAILIQRERRGESIGCLLSKGAGLPAAMLGVLKAGKIYVFLNPSFPQARINFMLRDSQSTLLLTDNDHLSMAKGFVGDRLPLINVDDLDSTLSMKNPGISISPTAFIWINYTSGSTGQPKGVVQNHRNWLHLIMTQTNDLHICSEDRFLTLTAVAGEVLLAVLNGAAISPVNFQKEGMAVLSDWLIQEEITVYNSVPSIFRHFVNSLRGDETFPKLRLIRFTGEPLYRTDVDLYRKHFPQSCIVVNRLSSQEVPAFRQYFINHSTAITDSVVPVGYAIGDNEVLLIGSDGQEVSINEIGEVAVKSRHLSPGYWRNPDFTQAKFSSAPGEEEKRIYKTGDLGRMNPDGCLVYLGRKDFQVKIRGNRVELAEIERALLDLGIFNEAVVVPLEDRPGEQRLVAYVVPTSRTAVMLSAPRRFLSEKLPEYMIPSTFVVLNALPLAPNGKVDRSALPLPVLGVRPELDTPFVSPRTTFEETVTGIWAEILGVDRVGIHDNFLDLGGDSLVAARIISTVFKTFQVEVPLPLFFGAPTVADMAAVIEQYQGKMLGEKELDKVVAELESLTEQEAQRLLSQGVSKEPAQ